MVRSPDELPIDLTNTLETLAAQVGLALDREVLTEAFHARRSEARFQTLVQNASDVILIARPDTTVVYQTPSAQRILGYGPAALEGVQLTSLLHENDVEQAVAAYGGVAFRAGTSITAEWRIRHGDGSWRHVEVVANNLLGDPTVEGIVLTLRDVTERKGLEEELKHQAFHDALSGLANRALFRDRLEHALARPARSATSLAVLFLDLDDFKLINDSLGHAAGDELLVAVAGRLDGSLRTGDTAARFGGDEFAILLEETDDAEDACQVAERILADLKPPFQVKDRSVERPRQHRDRLQQARHGGPGRAAASGRRGHVRGQGQGQELLRGLQAGPAGGRERAAGADGGAAAGRRRAASSSSTTNPS